MIQPFSSRALSGFSIVSFGLALGVFYVSAVGIARFPEFNELSQVSGHVSRLSRERGVLTFQVGHDIRVFSYDSKGGEVDAVDQALHLIRREDIRVWADLKNPGGNALSGRFYDVYQIATAREQLRSYAQVRENFVRSYRWGFAMSLIYLGMGIALMWKARTGTPTHQPHSL